MVDTINSHTKSIGYEHKVYFCTEGGYLFCSYYKKTLEDGEWHKSGLKHDPMTENECFTYSQCDASNGHALSILEIIGIALACIILVVVIVCIGYKLCR